jgi:hypothetical protein
MVNKVLKNGVDLTPEFKIFQHYYGNNEELNSFILDALKNSFLKLKDSTKVQIDSTDSLVDQFISLINRHNLSENYLNNSESVKNFIVSKIHEIIESPSSQILANSPVSIKMHHEGADKAAELYGKISNSVSPYDNISYYEMQENASIGKKDVGIGANGLKVFFTISNYFNS